jgi:hypothetical protein
MPAINRQWKTVTKLTYDNTTDDYGQLRQGEPETELISVIWTQYSQKNVNNPNYTDIEIEALTVADLNGGDQILKDGVIYDVKFTIPGKYNQIFLKRHSDVEV